MRDREWQSESTDPTLLEAVAAEPLPRPAVSGKFLCAGVDRLWIKGVTYGTFCPRADGTPYPPPEVIGQDFGSMAALGLNAVRTYTVPPRFVLDAAAAHGLRLLIGLPWEQHVTFLDDPRRARSIVERVRAGVRACAGHPAVLGYAVGNEIPAPVVRWHGARPIERFLERLYETAKSEDPGGLVTYVNYPTTEYLELPFLDFVCFNVYLESPERLQAYLARLQNLTGDRPLVMGEVGLDSRRHGVLGQASALDWQIRTTFAAGCAGAFVFAWTDEWHRGGHDVEDWDFGLVDRKRRPKPSLAAVSRALEEVPFPKDLTWPRISVVVCTYNGARTIADCLSGLLNIDYPSFEVVVVDDGSTDDTAAIVQRFGFRLISTPNRGLSRARNTGLRAATGEIIAYIDDDARPDPHWLTYLASTMMSSTHAGVGGPNLPPPGDGGVAACVAAAPGGPTHVLLSDTEAEHIPGCNMAFWKSSLEAIDGFDPRFRTAGDDVDVCWRLQRRGWTLGFHPAAIVWHHRRASVRAYWKQQAGYGRAEAMLERKWPEKYNAAGHATWSGRVYGPTPALSWWRRRIYHGPWGTALFQSVYEPAPDPLASLVVMPEWHLLVGALAVLSVLGAVWGPLRLVLPVLGLAILATVSQAVMSAARARFPQIPTSRWRLLAWRGLTAWLHLLQPLARLRGRLGHGLTPWRRRGMLPLAVPWPLTFTAWTEQWETATSRLRALEAALHIAGVPVLRGGMYDRWDLEVRGGLLGGTRLLLAVEEHGAGRQLARVRMWPRCSPVAAGLMGLLVGLAAAAFADGAGLAGTILGGGALLMAARTVVECGFATGALLAVRRVLERRAPDNGAPPSA